MMINKNLLHGLLMGIFLLGFVLVSTEAAIPDCTAAYPSKAILWPPNHKFHTITIMGVTDSDGDSVAITITSIYSDEATAAASGSGGKKHAPDAIIGVGGSTAQVRAERSGAAPHNGRVYTINFTATAGGETCTGSVYVGVPHSKKSTPVNDSLNGGMSYDATV